MSSVHFSRCLKVCNGIKLGERGGVREVSPLMINCFKDLIHALMTVLLCKFLFLSLLCFFCKSLLCQYTSQVFEKNSFVSATNDDDDEDHVDGHGNDATEEDDAKEDDGDTPTLTSSLRKVDSSSKKKKVQWVDVMGIKKLAEIREFEPRLVGLLLSSISYLSGLVRVWS